MVMWRSAKPRKRVQSSHFPLVIKLVEPIKGETYSKEYLGNLNMRYLGLNEGKRTEIWEREDERFIMKQDIGGLTLVIKYSIIFRTQEPTNQIIPRFHD